jgi:hypothetical protein
MGFFDLPPAGAGDLLQGALLVLRDRRVVELRDVVRYSNLDDVAATFEGRGARYLHQPALGPIQHVGAINEVTGQVVVLDAQDLSGARLLREAVRGHDVPDAA